jgi:hypothetical protein
MVNIDTEYYKIARRYMLRLRKDDFEDERALERLARTASISPEEFAARFRYVVEGEAPPISFGG